MLCLDLIEEQDSFLADNITQFGDNENKNSIRFTFIIRKFGKLNMSHSYVRE